MKKSKFLAAALLGIFGLFSCSNENTTTTNENTDLTQTAPTLESLKQNPDIVWIGEVNVDYGLNYSNYEASPEEKKELETVGFKGVNVYKILKYQIADIEAADNDEHILINKLIKDIEKIACYKDEQLTQKLSPQESRKELESVDTIIVFDPKTMKELSQVVVNVTDPRDVKFFRVKQIIYYNKKDVTFKTIPLAIAPMVYERNDTNGIVGVTPLFWMKPNFIEAIPSLAAENITWAERMYRNFPVKDIKVVKADYPFEKVIDTMFYEIRNNAEKIVVGNTLDADGSQKLTKEELKSLGTSIDTIITFERVTFKETVKVVRTNFVGKDVEQLRLMQDFVWDAKSKQLGIRYVGFKPIVNRYDDMGNFLNSGPLFTLKVGDNK